MQPIRILTVSILALAALTLTLTSCSSSVSVGGGDEGAPASTTYTNDEYGFSITCSEPLEKYEETEGTGNDGSAVLSVAFADTDGPVVAGRYVDAAQVSLYELGREVDAAEVPDLESEMQGVVDDIMASLPSSQIVEPMSSAEVNGIPGYAAKYTYTQDGTGITAVVFFLIDGKDEYQITAQATTADWEKMKENLEATVQSFTVR